MKTKKIEKTVYVTEDGKEFFNKADAKNHEDNIRYWNELGKYEVKGPECTPFDMPKLMAYNYKWFLIKDKDDAKKIRQLLTSIAKRRLIILPEIEDFPNYIGYSDNHGTVHILSEMIKRHEEYEEKWNEFIKYFVKD